MIEFIEPANFENWNKVHKGIFKRGFYDYLDKISFDECPYKDKRNDSNRLTWSRSFIRAWQDGWLWAEKHYIGY